MLVVPGLAATAPIMTDRRQEHEAFDQFRMIECEPQRHRTAKTMPDNDGVLAWGEGFQNTSHLGRLHLKFMRTGGTFGMAVTGAIHHQDAMGLTQSRRERPGKLSRIG